MHIPLYARFKEDYRSLGTESLIRGYVDIPCLEWNFSKVRGYGRIAIGNNRIVPVHRVSYHHNVDSNFHIIPLDRKDVIDHLCRNEACFEPSHLEATTARVNAVRGKVSELRPKRVSNYPGVGRDPKTMRWTARINIDGKTRGLGYFDREEEAASVYQNMMPLVEAGGSWDELQKLTKVKTIVRKGKV